eukprot:CAMPEP_0114497596 /NCGR_PEP_ID=MMETSP0109-20121206/6416_1 /TAXON_ID=29199 /ORGANISM="Chlorarachnion reptans, Strain CCCM449" /LENGTH=55 /DNA_ID=CAMNT_0001675003 /DNA_START=310 /DNA_END=477 /DNA_ORIENTATION=+
MSKLARVEESKAAETQGRRRRKFQVLITTILDLLDLLLPEARPDLVRGGNVLSQS